MKKTILSVLILSLAACGVVKRPGTTQAAGGNSSARPLPPLTQVLIGTFKLEGSSQAVTAGQAKELLPLWEVYSSLLQSDTAAQAEIDGLVQQIQESMTPEQTKAIQAMGLTQRDVFALMQEQGIEITGGPRASGTPNANRSNANRGGFPPAGGFQGGGSPRGGGFPGGPGGFFQRSATPGANSGRNGANQARPTFDRVPTPLLNALIDFLKKRAGS
jgi:hypothetical protein